jgi:hypothetical protein
MKIKSNFVFNTSLLAQHTPTAVDGKIVIGGSQPKDLILPAGATLELEDVLWTKYFEASAQDYLKSGHLKITEAVKLSKVDEAKAKKARAASLKAELAELEAAEKVAGKEGK